MRSAPLVGCINQDVFEGRKQIKSAQVLTLHLGSSFPGVGEGVTIAGASAGGPVGDAGDDDEDIKDVMDDDDDEDLDLFGEMTEEEQEAAAERKKIVEAKIAKSKANAAKAKSMIIIDVKPWDDETGSSQPPMHI